MSDTISYCSRCHSEIERGERGSIAAIHLDDATGDLHPTCCSHAEVLAMLKGAILRLNRMETEIRKCATALDGKAPPEFNTPCEKYAWMDAMKRAAENVRSLLA